MQDYHFNVITHVCKYVCVCVCVIYEDNDVKLYYIECYINSVYLTGYMCWHVMQQSKVRALGRSSNTNTEHSMCSIKAN